MTLAATTASPPASRRSLRGQSAPAGRLELGRLRRRRHHAADRRRDAVRGGRPARRRARARRRRRQRQCDARGGAPLRRRDLDRLRAGAARARRAQRADAERLAVDFQEADAEALPFADGELRRRAVDVRRDVHAGPGAGGGRAAARLPAAAAASAWPTGRPTASSASCSRRIGKHVPPPRRRQARRRCGARATWLDDAVRRHAPRASARLRARVRLPLPLGRRIGSTCSAPTTGRSTRRSGALDSAGQLRLAQDLTRPHRRFNRVGAASIMVVPSEYLEVVIEKTG